MRKIVLIASILLLFSTAVVMRFVSPVVADGTIYIKPDGSVGPPTASIRRDGNVYTFTDNINDSIVVERDNIVVDGAGYTLQGTGSGTGIYLSDRSNVQIRNMQIRLFENGIYLEHSSDNNIYENTITNNDRGIHVYRSSENIFYHNNFIDNMEQVHLRFMRENVWDDGYPSGGNYWSDYLGVDQNRGENQNIPGIDGIGDTPYVIDDDDDDNGNNIDYYPLMNKWSLPPDTMPPIVSIISPENKTYAVTTVPLTFTLSEATPWIGYSLDNQANVTIDGNTILIGLPDGTHTITVYANDNAGNIGSSDTIYFAIDTVAPKIEIVSPKNKTYTTDSVSMSFTVNEPTSWIGYSLDGQANNTIVGNATLIALSDGRHSLIVYASDILGNMGSSEMVYFTVDTSLPSIIILSPENRTYDTTAVPLTFTVDEPALWMAYSLDRQTNVTITGNTTLPLLDGMHYVVVYANDIADNVGASSMVYFTVDSETPTVSLISPTNTSYASTSVPLSFVIYEPTSWIGYSLDGQMNVTVSGNTTIVGLSDGPHTITVYANDTTGNMGSSSIVYFTVDTTLSTVSVLSPENRTYDTTDIPLAFTIDESVSWMAYSLDGQTNVTITGDTTLSGLSKGLHSLIVYVRDTAGNTGASEIVYFTIEFQQPGPTQLWIVALITVIAGAGFAFTGYLAYDLFKRPRNELRPRIEENFSHFALLRL